MSVIEGGGGLVDCCVWGGVVYEKGWKKGGKGRGRRAYFNNSFPICMLSNHRDREICYISW